MCKRLSAQLRFRRLWWSLLVAAFLHEGVCLSGGVGGAPRNERSEFWGLASDTTCIKTSTRPALTPFTQCNRTLIFKDGFCFKYYSYTRKNQESKCYVSTFYK